MAYEVLVLDVDGTLVNSKKEITKATKEAVIQCQQNGIKVVIASGRCTEGIRHQAEELELQNYGGYILSYNGDARSPTLLPERLCTILPFLPA